MSNDSIFQADQFDIQEVDNPLINKKVFWKYWDLFLALFDKIVFFSLIFVENESNMVK